MSWNLRRSRTTGWRDITGLIQIVPRSGRLLICREGNSVYVHAEALTFGVVTSSFVEVDRLPVGFRPPREVDLPTALRSGSDVNGAIRLLSGGGGYLYRVAEGSPLRSIGSFLTNNPMPSPAEYPGVGLS